ncbi:MAG: hypothetical protein HQL08_11115 [Nitrospirae bacterium]|nr:hypothetical protein [Nitrospirota bacterium]
MESDMLRDVIAVESDIQKNLDLEKKRVCEWLDKVRNDAEEEIVREEERVREELARSIVGAKAEAEAEAAEIVEKAVARAGILKGLGSESLKDIALKRITRILPGGIL